MACGLWPVDPLTLYCARRLFKPPAAPAGPSAGRAAFAAAKRRTTACRSDRAARVSCGGTAGNGSDLLEHSECVEVVPNLRHFAVRESGAVMLQEVAHTPGPVRNSGSEPA